jgi:hypothetical protein
MVGLAAALPPTRGAKPAQGIAADPPVEPLPNDPMPNIPIIGSPVAMGRDCTETGAMFEAVTAPPDELLDPAADPPDGSVDAVVWDVTA